MNDLLYAPALPFVVIGAICNYICKCVIGGFVAGWKMNIASYKKGIEDD